LEDHASKRGKRCVVRQRERITAGEPSLNVLLLRHAELVDAPATPTSTPTPKKKHGKGHHRRPSPRQLHYLVNSRCQRESLSNRIRASKKLVAAETHPDQVLETAPHRASSRARAEWGERI